jgi:hypothetical protein
VDRTIEIDRRKNESDRRGAEAREERNYLAARRRVVALEKALEMVVGALVPRGHTVDPTKTARFRQGIEVARSLLGEKPGD